MATMTKTKKVNEPVKGSVKVIRAVVAPCVMCPDGLPGLVEITSETQKGPVRKSYVLVCFATLTPESLTVDGYRLTESGSKSAYESYDLPADLSCCECLDNAFRPREGGCKHQKALLALRRQGKLPY